MSRDARRLRRRLASTDVLALTAAWSVASATAPQAGGVFTAPRTLMVVGPVVVTMALIAATRLDRLEVASSRSRELQTLAAAVALGASVSSLAMAEPARLARPSTLAGALLGLGFLLVGRLVFRAWLRASRARGRYVRPVVLLGASSRAEELREMFADHTELGLRVVGVVGSRNAARRNGLADLWLGDEDWLRHHGGLGQETIVVDPGPATTDLAIELVRRGVTVHLAGPLDRIHDSRLTALVLGGRPLVHVSARPRGRRQLLAKRVLDVVVAAVALVVTAPILLAAAAAIRLEDGGGVVFRQERVGKDGRRFDLLKLRTMVDDAEHLLIDLTAENSRHGPLFKLESDPRVTRVGRILRALSVDELPQLVNVLRGEMSMVGPRPALPSEHALFDDELRTRVTVMPGITGLWQVEARDNPSFTSYRRLDLFYVENWSITLDLTILVATFESELARLLLLIGRRLERRREATAARHDASRPGPIDAPHDPRPQVEVQRG